MYKVINRFRETHHNNHIYEVGDTYPAEGKKLVASRAEFLRKKHAQYDVAFLEKVEEKLDDKPAAKKTSTKNSADEPEKSDA